MTSKSAGLRIAGVSFGGGSTGKLPPSKSAVMPLPETGHVSILSSDPPIAVKLKLGPTPSQTQGGLGGWNANDRPRRKAASEWTGTPLETLTVSIVLDGFWGSGLPVEGNIAVLKSLASPGGLSFGEIPPDVEPPVLRLGGMVPHGNKQWVLNDIAWDEEDTIWIGLQRFRQYAILNFLEYDAAAPIKTKRPTSASSGGTKTRTISARKGDTVAEIVRRELKPKTGAALRSAIVKVKALNSIRSSKKVLKAGTKVKLPTSGAK